MYILPNGAKAYSLERICSPDGIHHNGDILLIFLMAFVDYNYLMGGVLLNASFLYLISLHSAMMS